MTYMYWCGVKSLYNLVKDAFCWNFYYGHNYENFYGKYYVWLLSSICHTFCMPYNWCYVYARVLNFHVCELLVKNIWPFLQFFSSLIAELFPFCKSLSIPLWERYWKTIIQVGFGYLAYCLELRHWCSGQLFGKSVNFWQNSAPCWLWLCMYSELCNQLTFYSPNHNYQNLMFNQWHAHWDAVYYRNRVKNVYFESSELL